MKRPSSSKSFAVIPSPQNELPGIRMVGFHGEVDAAHTPARRAPILADDEGWLVRLLPPEEESPVRIQAERGSLQVSETGPLSGVGTRLGPWPARLGYTVVLMGRAEQRAAPRFASHTPMTEPEVEKLITWLAQGSPPTSAPDRVARLDGLVAWYCSEAEAHSLWLSILQEAKLTLHHAFAEHRHHPGHQLEEAAWWLSRAALSDEDLYLAAACLKHAGSPHAEAMLRAMLREPPGSAEMLERMSAQLLFLDAEARLGSHELAPVGMGAPREHSYAVLTSARDSVRRHSGLIPRAS